MPRPMLFVLPRGRSSRPWPWFCFLLFGVLMHGTLARGGDIYVSPRGNDAWSGKLAEVNPSGTDGPVASLERARELIRAEVRQAETAGPLHVYLRGGLYELSKPLALTREDSGSERNPVMWSSYPREIARLSGGKKIGPFLAVTDASVLTRLPPEARTQVLVADLKQSGISDFGEVAADRRRSELFYRQEPMTLARWPNEGFVKIQAILNLEPFTTHGIKGDRQGKFVYDQDRPQRWQSEPDGWLSGYWFWDWSDGRQRIASIDPLKKTLELQPPHHNYGYRQGQRYFAFNLLAELDRPGEWYLDRERGQLYFWPPGPLQDDVEFSILPTLITLQEAQQVTLRGLLLENTRGTAVTISGGGHVLVEGCRIRNTGGWGVSITGGFRNGVSGCDIHHTGEGGISLSGGDRKSLTAAELFAENNHIHHYARLVRTYRPAVGINGVGNRVAHNHIHDAPHNAIQLSGNEHRIEFNDIHHVCEETGDVGAFYMGRDWTMRGNSIRHNFFHEISGPGLHGAMAVYLDDAASGTTIFGNIFYRASRAAFIGGGRDNLVENNIFVENQPSVHLDARGLGWMHAHVDPGGVMPQRLQAMPYKTPPWSERYPELVTLLEETPAAPSGNKVLRNISVGGTWKHVEAKAEQGIEFRDNLVDVDPRFVNAAERNFALQDDSPAYALGFQKIPIEHIGLLDDESRQWIPAGNPSR